MNIDWKDLFLSPKGRIGQKEYLIGIGILFILGIINNRLIQPMSAEASSVVGLILLYPGYCVLGSRFADMGKSAKLAFLPYGLLGLGYILALVGVIMAGGSAAMGSDAGAMGGVGLLGIGGICLMIGALLWLIFVIWAAVAKGDPGPNAYGPPPGDPTAKA